jgi:hypothetical protein
MPAHIIMLLVSMILAGRQRMNTVNPGIGFTRIPVSTKIIAAEREMATAKTAL